jgi:hypothetical protein
MLFQTSGGVDIHFHTFLTWALHGVAQLVTRPGSFIPSEAYPYPPSRGLGGPQSRSGRPKIKKIKSLMSVVCRATNRIVLVSPAVTLLIVATKLWFWTLELYLRWVTTHQTLIFFIFISFCKKSGTSVYM